MRRYVFANVVQSVPVLASLNAADAILTLAALSFLGIGIDPSAAAEWGYDISRGIADAQAGYWWTGLFPGLAIILLVTGLTLVGESLNDTVNPILRRADVAVGRRCRRRRRHRSAGSAGLATRCSSVRDLRVHYGTPRGAVRAVDGVSFDLRRGETLGLVGESGCGKSSLGRGLLGLAARRAPCAPARSTSRAANLVRLSGERAAWLRGPSIGLVFQEPMTRLDPLMTVSDHFAEALRDARAATCPTTRYDARSLAALGQMGIPPTRFSSYPYEFSGGMRQRIMIALTLVLRPAVRHRRRADDGARRARRGADPRDPRRPQARPRHWRCCSSPTTSASSRRRATGSR